MEGDVDRRRIGKEKKEKKKEEEKGTKGQTRNRSFDRRGETRREITQKMRSINEDKKTPRCAKRRRTREGEEEREGKNTKKEWETITSHTNPPKSSIIPPTTIQIQSKIHPHIKEEKKKMRKTMTHIPPISHIIPYRGEVD